MHAHQPCLLFCVPSMYQQTCLRISLPGCCMQVPAQPSVYLAQIALPAQCQDTVIVDVVGTFSSNRAMGPQVLSEPVSGVSFEKTSVAPALETQAVSIFTAFTQS